MAEVLKWTLERKGPFWESGRSEARAAKGAYQALLKAGLVLQSAVVQNTPVGVAGALRRAWFLKQDRAQLSVSVVNPMEYALAVEQGRRPAFPPLKPIELWVRRKLGIPQPAAAFVALAIARKKAHRRTPGQKFAKNTFQRIQGELLAILQTAKLTDG